MFVNAHTHIYSGLVPFGLPPPAERPETFLQILERIWWRLDRALDAASLAAAARYYVGDALLLGTTLLVDHHESPSFIDGSLDVIADVCSELGMQAVLCYGATERNGGREEAARGLAECHRFLHTNRRPGIRGLVGLHASFTVSDETIREAGDLCREHRTALHIHVAEDQIDVDDAERRGYGGVIDRLDKLGALVPGSILAHGVHLSAREVQLADERGCWFVHNPRSNRNNGVGFAAPLDAASRVALGTDGFPSDMLTEQRALESDAQQYDGRVAVRQSRLARGRDLASTWFGDRRANDVTPSALTIDGRTVVANGHLLTGNWEAICEEARQQASRLWSRMSALGVGSI